MRGTILGAYKDTRTIEFDGTIEKFYKKDVFPGFPLMKELWYRYTYNDGKIFEDQGSLLQQIINEQSWNESFQTCTITTI